MTPTLLVTRFADLCEGQCTSKGTGLPAIGAGKSQLTAISQLVFGIIGAVAVIMIIIAGIQFAASQGDPQGAAKARNTIIYSVVGLVVAISAEVIVTFVLGRV